MTKLSIIILSYNTKVLTLRCIESIIKQYEKELAQKELEIIIVDNNSSDDSVSAISSLSLKNYSIKLILNKENMGFAKACNIGAKVSSGQRVLFLNSDTEVLDKGFFGMVKFLDNNPKVGILGGKLENSDGSIQSSTGKFYNLGNLILMLLGMERLGFLRSSPSKIEKVDWVSGACMMVKSKVFKELTGFDEKLFMYVEDMELCFRAQKIGYKTYFYPSIKLRHKSLGSSNRTFAIINIYKGIFHFYSKHKSHFEYIVVKMLLITKAGILILVGLLTFNSDLRDRYKRAIS